MDQDNHQDQQANNQKGSNLPDNSSDQKSNTGQFVDSAAISSDQSAQGNDDAQANQEQTDYQKRNPLQKNDQEFQKPNKKSSKRRRRRRRKSTAKKQETSNLKDQKIDNRDDNVQDSSLTPDLGSTALPSLSQPFSEDATSEIVSERETPHVSQVAPDHLNPIEEGSPSDSFALPPENQSSEVQFPEPEPSKKEEEATPNFPEGDESQLYSPQIQYIHSDPVENKPEPADSVHTITFDPADYAYEPLSSSLNEDQKFNEQGVDKNNGDHFQNEKTGQPTNNFEPTLHQEFEEAYQNNVPEASSDFLDHQPGPQPSEQQNQSFENQPFQESEPYSFEEKGNQTEDFFGHEKDHFFPRDVAEKDILENQEESSSPKQPSDQGLEEKKSFLDQLDSFLKNIKEKTAPLFSQMKGLGGGFLRNCFFLVLVIGLIYGGYALNIHQIGYKYLQDLFSKPKEEPVEIDVDIENLNEWGISTGLLFGRNKGTSNDRIESSIQNAFYFGKLQEPAEQGETGITPAYHFGLREDEKIETNRFIQYIDHLRSVQELYRVDVYAMLDQTTSRDEKLFEYLGQLQEMQQQSEDILNLEIFPQIDEFKISYNSLNPDRTRYEQEFFNALGDLAGENADFLLKSFIDVSQKQSALRARLAALEQLASYYRTVLERLQIRIETVDKNKDALIQGIRVIDIPGNDLDIIIRER